MSEQLARDRDAAVALLEEWVRAPALRGHCFAVEAAMRAYARDLGADEIAWGCVGLLHDFDWERHPTLDLHPQAGEPVLRELGYPEWFRRAILSHAAHTGVARQSDLERHLFACDEITGFIQACALVRPDGLETLEARSVLKKLKQPSFAAAVDRKDVVEGAAGIGRELAAHIDFVVAALRAPAASV